jgi:hypothetical protein
MLLLFIPGLHRAMKPKLRSEIQGRLAHWSNRPSNIHPPQPRPVPLQGSVQVRQRIEIEYCVREE